MNDIKRRVDTTGWTPADFAMLDYTIRAQRPKWVRYFYDSLKDDPKIRWKDSIRRLLNLPEVLDGKT